MKTINRKMESNVIQTDTSKQISQASFNSDGCIVLRNYNRYEKNCDEIMILSEKETEAIILLFKKLKRHDILPF